MKRLKQMKHRSEQVAGRRIRKLAGTLDPKKHEDRLKKLEDIESIRRLKAAYCAACDDDHDGEAISALFIEDGIWQQSGKVGSAGIEPKQGRNAIAEFMFSLRSAGFIRHSAHMVTNPVIDVFGDEAKGSWRFIMVYSHIDSSFVRIIGHYEEEYVRREGKWYFRSLIAHVEESGRYLVKEL
tara:strand:- start:1709 stop:2254 length:546 start_codon:yes stop_codon:yes gene_type:complete